MALQRDDVDDMINALSDATRSQSPDSAGETLKCAVQLFGKQQQLIDRELKSLGPELPSEEHIQRLCALGRRIIRIYNLFEKNESICCNFTATRALKVKKKNHDAFHLSHISQLVNRIETALIPLVQQRQELVSTPDNTTTRTALLLVDEIHIQERRTLRFLEMSSLATLPRDVASTDRLFSHDQKRAHVFMFVSTFLYMTNYYIVSVFGKKLAVHFHAQGAFSGAIVGAMPFAAFFAALLFSFWSNTSFKRPLLCSAVLLSIGNLLYSAAIPVDSFSLLLISRVCCGLGAPRVLARRYIAEYIPPERRTTAALLFVASSALGAALGPGLAGLLNAVPPTELLGGGLVISPLTLPGLIMLPLWIIFTVACALWFDDPIGRLGPGGSPLLTPESRPLLTSFSPWTAPMPTTSVCIEDPPPVLEESKLELPPPPPPRESMFAVRVGLLVYFSIKLAHEGFVNSCPIVTEDLFGWTPTFVGFFISILALAVLPSSVGLGAMSHRWRDSSIIIGLLGGCVVGLLTASGILFEVSEVTYVLGSSLYFLCTQTVEGAVMSAVAFRLPSKLATGFLNAGFLATEAGTAGRAFGNGAIVLIGTLTTTSRSLLQYLFLAITTVMVASFFLSVLVRRQRR